MRQGFLIPIAPQGSACKVMTVYHQRGMIDVDHDKALNVDRPGGGSFEDVVDRIEMVLIPANHDMEWLWIQKAL